MMLRQHPDAVKKLCVECHDAHSSNRPMLLRGRSTPGSAIH
jgi:predicted CXXCH cytochrome family protein